MLYRMADLDPLTIKVRIDPPVPKSMFVQIAVLDRKFIPDCRKSGTRSESRFIMRQKLKGLFFSV